MFMKFHNSNFVSRLTSNFVTAGSLTAAIFSQTFSLDMTKPLDRILVSVFVRLNSYQQEILLQTLEQC